MRFVFLVGHDGFIRNFEPVLRELSARGHTVHLALGGRRATLMSAAESVEQLAAELPGMTFARAPKTSDHELAQLEQATIAARDYLRFLEPEYADAPKLRARAASFVPADLVRAVERGPLRSPAARHALDALLRRVQRVLPESPGFAKLLREQRADALLVTPLIGFRSRQVAAVRTARKLGVPTVLLVHSWDNLTNKGVLHELPDRVVVWNADQAREAVELHGVAERSITVTGAQSYDPWFETQPSLGLDDFCARVGLPPRRFVLYVGSSSFIAPDEPAFIRRWLAALRAHPATADVPVLLRPHPQNPEGWQALSDSRPEHVAIWPLPGASYAGVQARADYFDAIHHSGAVVGINTSAMIEAAIQSRPVLTVTDPAFSETQGGTLHFEYLSGFLRSAPGLEAHAAQLADALADPAGAAEDARRFLARFVRPHGLDDPATPFVVDAIEAAGAPGVGQPAAEPRWYPPLRTALRPSVRLLDRMEARAKRES